MFIRNDVFNVRKSVERIVGSKVKLESNKGRHKTIIKEGVIENAYPSIFIIQLYEGLKPSGKVSYSYTDVLTKAVSITLCD